MSPRLSIALLSLLASSAVSCKTAYYGFWEQLGIEKRDLMVERVEEAREAQSDAKEEFVSALDRFRATVHVDADELESTYDDLADTLEESEERATEVRERVAEVESVSEDLFEEWEDELDEYEDPDLRRSSAEMLERTQEQYEDLITAMKKAAKSMDPVLATFRDHVRFLKHNLNAQAIASLEGELGAIEASTGALVRDMEAAIAEADAFLAGMK